jgi:O-antigen ligase
MIRHAARIAVWLAIAALSAVLVSAFFQKPIPASVTAGLAGLAALAVWRPGDALVVLAGLGPLSGVIQALTGTPYHAHLFLEVAILIVLGGAALHAAARRSALVTTPFEWAAVGFACVALASCVAQMPIVFLREGIVASGAAVLDLLSQRYFVERPPAYPVVRQTAMLVEGAMLAALVARAFRAERGHRLAWIIIAGSAGAAALNVHRLLEVSLRNPPFLAGLLRTLRDFRFNTQFPDLNAAGSFFAMAGVLCLGWAGWKAPQAAIRTALLPLFAVALWVSGSRVALAATLICGPALIVFRRRGFVLRGIGRRTLLAGGVVLALTFVGVLFLLPTTRHGTFGYSVFTRVELLKTGIRMAAARPLFGIGTSQFYERFPQYASAELREAFLQTLGYPVERENAHNQFLQIFAELGLTGLVTFTLLLFLAMRTGAEETGPDRAAAIAALAAFLLTCLAGHPLLTPMVANPFWIVLGLAAATAPPLPPRFSRRLGRGVMALGVVLLILVPVRWIYERKNADLAGVMVGVSGWQLDDSGVRFRWAGERCAIYVPAEAAVIRLPLKAGGNAPTRVDIRLDGEPAAGIVVPAGDWTEATLLMRRQADAPAFRRIDLVVATEGAGVAASSRLLMVGQPVEILR